jgi:hypothetical protein
MTKGPYDEPTKVDAVDGEVTLDGPDGVGLSVTPRAARRTARRLEEGADKADDQRVRDSWVRPPA